MPNNWWEEPAVAQELGWTGQKQGFTGFGDDGMLQPSMPTGMVQTQQGPRMVHEGESWRVDPNNRLHVTPAGPSTQQRLLQTQRIAGIPGYEFGTPPGGVQLGDAYSSPLAPAQDWTKSGRANAYELKLFNQYGVVPDWAKQVQTPALPKPVVAPITVPNPQLVAPKTAAVQAPALPQTATATPPSPAIPTPIQSVANPEERAYYAKMSGMPETVINSNVIKSLNAKGIMYTPSQATPTPANPAIPTPVSNQVATPTPANPPIPAPVAATQSVASPEERAYYAKMSGMPESVINANVIKSLNAAGIKYTPVPAGATPAPANPAIPAPVVKPVEKPVEVATPTPANPPIPAIVAKIPEKPVVNVQDEKDRAAAMDYFRSLMQGNNPYIRAIANSIMQSQGMANAAGEAATRQELAMAGVEGEGMTAAMQVLARDQGAQMSQLSGDIAKTAMGQQAGAAETLGGMAQQNIAFSTQTSQWDKSFNEGVRQFNTTTGQWERNFEEGKRQWQATYDRGVKEYEDTKKDLAAKYQDEQIPVDATNLDWNSFHAKYPNVERADYDKMNAANTAVTAGKARVALAAYAGIAMTNPQWTAGGWKTDLEYVNKLKAIWNGDTELAKNGAADFSNGVFDQWATQQTRMITGTMSSQRLSQLENSPWYQSATAEEQQGMRAGAVAADYLEIVGTLPPRPRADGGYDFYDIDGETLLYSTDKTGKIVSSGAPATTTTPKPVSTPSPTTPEEREWYAKQSNGALTADSVNANVIASFNAKGIVYPGKSSISGSTKTVAQVASDLNQNDEFIDAGITVLTSDLTKYMADNKGAVPATVEDWTTWLTRTRKYDPASNKDMQDVVNYLESPEVGLEDVDISQVQAYMKEKGTTTMPDAQAFKKWALTAPSQQRIEEYMAGEQGVELSQADRVELERIAKNPTQAEIAKYNLVTTVSGDNWLSNTTRMKMWGEGNYHLWGTEYDPSLSRPNGEEYKVQARDALRSFLADNAGKTVVINGEAYKISSNQSYAEKQFPWIILGGTTKQSEVGIPINLETMSGKKVIWTPYDPATGTANVKPVGV